MSEFEFVLVTIAIVAGFAISEILAGWSRPMLAAGNAGYSSLRFFASLFLLFLTLRYVWALWGVRSSGWHFLLFALALVPMLLIALAAYVISMPAETPELDSTEIYFVRAPVAGCLVDRTPAALRPTSAGRGISGPRRPQLASLAGRLVPSGGGAPWATLSGERGSQLGTDPSGGNSMLDRQGKLLRRAFLLGAITDGLALIPMLVPGMAGLLWGFADASGPYWFAMGYGASLMLGWTALLVWAYQRPIERRFVAALTVLVIYGLIATEVLAVLAGHLEAWRMIPTWCIQGVLLFLFASAYHYPSLRRWVAA